MGVCLILLNFMLCYVMLVGKHTGQSLLGCWFFRGQAEAEPRLGGRGQNFGLEATLASRT